MYSFERETNAGTKLVGVCSILYALSMGKIVLECTVIKWKKIEDMVFSFKILREYYEIFHFVLRYLILHYVIQHNYYPSFLDLIVILLIFHVECVFREG